MDPDPKCLIFNLRIPIRNTAGNNQFKKNVFSSIYSRLEVSSFLLSKNEFQYKLIYIQDLIQAYQNNQEIKHVVQFFKNRYSCSHDYAFLLASDDVLYFQLKKAS